MAFKTMQQLATDIQLDIYQSSGPAVQVYGQDIIVQKVQDAFDHLFEMMWWPRFIVRESNLPLDGVTGQIAGTTTIKDSRDLRYVYYNDDRTPMPKMPLDYNTGTLTGTSAQFMEITANAKLVRVWPLSSTGSISLVGRVRPAAFAFGDTVPFDPLCIRHFAAWSYFTDDGSNPASASKHQGLFETRLKRVEDSEFNQPISLNNTSGRIPTTWTERPWG